MSNMAESAQNHPLNLNSSEFDPEAYVNNLILKKRLDELVAVEEDMVQNVRRLDNEMQHLVYENYNKFLTATNTVRKMQTEFNKLDEEMNSLSDKMARISGLSSDLSGIFREHRENVRKLTDASKTVKSLQYVVKLPQKLQACYEARNYQKAIKSFNAVKNQLEAVKSYDSIKGIYKECSSIINKIERKLRESLKSPVLSSEDFVENVKLLNNLGIPLENLEKELSEQWTSQINSQMEPLANEVDVNNKNKKFNDILEFVENGVCPFLADISLIASLYVQIFKGTSSTPFIQSLSSKMTDLKQLIVIRFEQESNPRECALYVRALDRVYRKISACCKLIPDLDFSVENTSIVVDAAHHQINICRKGVAKAIDLALDEISNEIKTASPSNSSTSSKYSNHYLSPFQQKLEQTYLVSVKTFMANLLLFTASDITFLTSQESAHTFSSFGVDVHEQVVVSALQDLAKLSTQKAETLPSDCNLMLGIFLHSITKKNLKYLMDLCQEQYKITEEAAEALLTRPANIIKTLDEAALKVLARYAEQQGTLLYQNLESDLSWPQSKQSPSQIRAQTQSLVKDVQALDECLQVLMDDSTKKERTPDSSRSHGQRRLPTHLAQSAELHGQLERMWADAQEEFTAPKIDFKRYAILGCILDRCLRLFLDWIKKTEFSRFGVQQLQVDSFYLKQTLWRFVSDEMALNVLVDEALTAAVNLCEDPKLLEPTLVKDISLKATVL